MVLGEFDQASTVSITLPGYGCVGANDLPTPADTHYGRTKHEAEPSTSFVVSLEDSHVSERGHQYGRCLVYGPGVNPGQHGQTMLRWTPPQRASTCPLAWLIHNKRSLSSMWGISLT